MPKSDITYSKLSTIARGFADSLVYYVNSSSKMPSGMTVRTRDFTEFALEMIREECSAFLDIAGMIHPGGKNGVRGAIAAHDLGWHFFLARQRTGIGFENFSLGEFGQNLDALALRFPVITVAVSDGEIDFL